MVSEREIRRMLVVKLDEEECASLESNDGPAHHELRTSWRKRAKDAARAAHKIYTEAGQWGRNNYNVEVYADDCQIDAIEFSAKDL